MRTPTNSRIMLMTGAILFAGLIASKSPAAFQRAPGAMPAVPQPAAAPPQPTAQGVTSGRFQLVAAEVDSTSEFQPAPVAGVRTLYRIDTQTGKVERLSILRGSRPGEVTTESWQPVGP